MTRAITTLGAALLLCSCGGSGGGTGGNAAATANAATTAGNSAASAPSGTAPSAAVELRPGQWETTVEMLRLEVPNLPSGVDLPKQAPITVRSCLTPEEARRSSGGFMTGKQNETGCDYSHLSLSAGRVQGTVTCNNRGGMTRATLNGRFSPEAYRMEVDAEVQTRGMTSRTASRISGRRIGDCPAGAKEGPER